MPKNYLPFINGMEFGGKRTKQYLHDVHCTIVEQLAMLGLSKVDIAKTFFNIKEKDFDTWEKIYPDFSDAYEQGSLMADAAVTKSLFNRARGVTVTKQKVGKDNQIVEIEEELPPDTAACLAWLERKRGEKWIKEKNSAPKSDNPLGFILDELDSNLIESSVLPSAQDWEDFDDE